MNCPVCGSEAEQGKSTDYGERRQFACPRCGPFEITGTALGMLASRIDADPLARPRLSHAIRLGTRDDDWLLVTSANLDELVSTPLPGIAHQMHQFLHWSAARAGDDRLGPITLPSLESLAAVIGAVDGERVHRLLHHLAQESLIKVDEDKNQIHLTPQAWARLEPEQTSKTHEDRSEPMTEPQIIQVHCNKCGGERRSFVRATHTRKEDNDVISWSYTYEILECCGCGELSVRRQTWFSEWDDLDVDPLTGKEVMVPGIRVSYWPAIAQRSRPEWLDSLNDDALRSSLEEVYAALDHDLLILAAIGTRTVLDRAMYIRIKDPPGGFRGKLDAMVKAGRIGADERNILEAMTDAGSAAAHRGFTPNLETLNTILDTVENFLQRDFVLSEAANEVRQKTPPRPSQN